MQPQYLIDCCGMLLAFCEAAAAVLRLNVPANRRSLAETARKGRCSRRRSQTKMPGLQQTKMPGSLQAAKVCNQSVTRLFAIALGADK